MSLVLYPDDYTGSVLSGTVESLQEGVVFLPAAGYRCDSDVCDFGVIGYYWSSSAISNGAYGVSFSNDNGYTYGESNVYVSHGVRLVTDAK